MLRNASADTNTLSPLQMQYRNFDIQWFTFDETCLYYALVSILSFYTKEQNDGNTYVCVATVNNMDVIIGNMTIYTLESKLITFLIYNILKTFLFYSFIVIYIYVIVVYSILFS